MAFAGRHSIEQAPTHRFDSCPLSAQVLGACIRRIWLELPSCALRARLPRRAGRPTRQLSMGAPHESWAALESEDELDTTAGDAQAVGVHSLWADAASEASSAEEVADEKGHGAPEQSGAAIGEGALEAAGGGDHPENQLAMISGSPADLHGHGLPVCAIRGGSAKALHQALLDDLSNLVARGARMASVAKLATKALRERLGAALEATAAVFSAVPDSRYRESSAAAMHEHFFDSSYQPVTSERALARFLGVDPEILGQRRQRCICAAIVMEQRDSLRMCLDLANAVRAAAHASPSATTACMMRPR